MNRFLAVLLIPAIWFSASSALSMPNDATTRHLSQGITTRQTIVAPPPCVPIYPPPSEFETQQRFSCFAHAFLVTKNLTEAFQYISEGYVVSVWTFDLVSWPCIYNTIYLALLLYSLTRCLLGLVSQNHNPFVTQNGSQAAFDFLAPIWPSTNITFQRKLFRGDMGWVNYNSSAAGEIIDRFRWEAGCIVEHVSIPDFLNSSPLANRYASGMLVKCGRRTNSLWMATGGR